MYLARRGAVYYYRRPILKELIGVWAGPAGKPRKEWSVSLRTKDRREAIDRMPAAERQYRRELTAAIDAARSAGQAVLGSAGSQAADEMHRASLEAALASEVIFAEQERAAADDPMHSAKYRLNGEARRLREEREGRAWAAVAKVEGRPRLDLLDLFTRWAALPGRHPQVTKRWRAYVEALTTFLGHTDANRLTRADLIRWRNHLRDDAMYRDKRLSPKTINDGYLAAVNATLSHAVGDGLLDSNPMAGVTKVLAPKAVELRDRDLTLDEALTILRAADAHDEPDRRWLPWLMAYTGTRVSEPAQLRKEDVQVVEGVHVLRLTPEAGSIKNRKARLVPVHPHLVDLGFLDFVKALPAGPLFGDPAKVSRRVGDWVRQLGVTAPQPNHAWRHRFKTVARAAGIPEYIADAIQGHAPRHEGGKYGSVPLTALKDAIDKVPRYEP